MNQSCTINELSNKLFLYMESIYKSKISTMERGLEAIIVIIQQVDGNTRDPLFLQVHDFFYQRNSTGYIG